MNDIVTRGHDTLQILKYKKSGIMVMYRIASSSGQSFPLKLVSDFTS